MKRFHFIALSIFLFLLPLSAQAAEKLTGFYVSSTTATEEGQLPIDAVSWYQYNSKYYLFLPGTADASQMHIYYTGVSQISLNDQPISNGEVFSFTVGEIVKLRVGNKKASYSVKVMQGSHIPTLFIETESGSLKTIEASKKNKEKGMLLALDENGQAVYDGNLAHIKIRGNMSTRFNKKSYTIKLEKSTDMFGFGKTKKWVLIGNARDKSLLRNQITYDMAQYVGLAYSSDCRQVEVYINHEYRGTYLFSDKIQISDASVDITDLQEATELLNEAALETYPKVGSTKPAIRQFKAYDIPSIPDDITGGYLVEYEIYASRYKEELSAYYTTHKRVLVVKDPAVISTEQAEYIFSFMQGFENAIFAENGIDPDTGKHYSDFVDMESLTKKFMIEEISKNYDANNSSQYFYKPSDSESEKAYCGPVWDYDSAYGSYARAAGTHSYLSPRGLQQTTNSAAWWPRLYEKSDFVSAVCETWQNSFVPAIRVLLGQETDESGTLLSIKQYAENIRASANMNFIRWPMKQSSNNSAKTGKTYDANIDYLTNFISERYDFLQEKWETQE